MLVCNNHFIQKLKNITLNNSCSFIPNIQPTELNIAKQKNTEGFVIIMKKSPIEKESHILDHIFIHEMSLFYIQDIISAFIHTCYELIDILWCFDYILRFLRPTRQLKLSQNYNYSHYAFKGISRLDCTVYRGTITLSLVYLFFLCFHPFIYFFSSFLYLVKGIGAKCVYIPIKRAIAMLPKCARLIFTSSVSIIRTKFAHVWIILSSLFMNRFMNRQSSKQKCYFLSTMIIGRHSGQKKSSREAVVFSPRTNTVVFRPITVRFCFADRSLWYFSQELFAMHRVYSTLILYPNIHRVLLKCTLNIERCDYLKISKMIKWIRIFITQV